MRNRILVAGVVTLLSGHVLAAADLDLGHRYLAVYLEINDAENLEKKADLSGALKDFNECYEKLKSIRKDSPYWETALVGHRIDDCQVKILALESRLKIQATVPFTVRVPSVSYPWKKYIATDLFWIGKDGVTHSAWDAN